MNLPTISKSDYLKHYEPYLGNKTATFFDSCKNFKSEIDCLRKVVKKYYVEENFDRSEDPVPVVEDPNIQIKTEYQHQLRKFDALGKIKNLLQCLLLFTKSDDDNDECLDMELFGLPLKEQKLVLLKRIKNLKHCKELGKKTLKKLQEELLSYQQKERTMTLEAISMTDLFNSKCKPVKILEKDINNEITRIKEALSKKYESLFLIKLKYEKVDVRMREIFIPKLTNLEVSLMEKRFELEKVQNDFLETMKQEKIQMKIDDEYDKKMRFLSKDYDRIVDDNEKLSNEIERMEKSLIRTFRKKDKLTKSFAEYLINSGQNSAIDKSLSEIQNNELSCDLCYVKNSTNNDYLRQDVAIINLREQICRMIQNISKSNNFINVLENDLKFLRNEHQKYGIGQDYMGNTIMTSKIEFNI
ncbi:GRIP and coiled-coil domain-containing protein-like [Chironomus tepperi]|uniref:GRIP and coiled-coil domain-containing protein-like n=1 Tax=Chironomus tepperi TaxID=113505 RepID=UPI00391FBF2D